MVQAPASHRWQQPLPTMYDLPSEDPEEPGLPDEFHTFQPTLLTETCRTPQIPLADCFTAQDLNLYYDPRHTLWHKRPDWFLVLGARRVERQEELRWSYVIWQEGVSPYLVVELLSPGTEAEDLGQTLRDIDKLPNKWQVYEQILRIPFYVVYDRKRNNLRVFRLEGHRYRELELSFDQVWLDKLGLGLGLWQGEYQGVEGKWLRWYDEQHVCIPTHAERFEQEKQRADMAQEQAETEKQRADALAQNQQESIRRLLALNLSVEQVAAALAIPVETVERLQ
ncbi:MAG: Uma2 family endonuclease [Cyanobacteria bacterium P01_G01_bin.54]